MLQIERAGAQQHADALQQLARAFMRAKIGQMAERGDERVEGVEQHADRRGEPHPLGRGMRIGQQQRARRLQLLGKRRLLADAARHRPRRGGARDR